MSQIRALSNRHVIIEFSWGIIVAMRNRKVCDIETMRNRTVDYMPQTWLPLFPGFTPHLLQWGIPRRKLDDQSASIQMGAVDQALESRFCVAQCVKLDERKTPVKVGLSNCIKSKSLVERNLKPVISSAGHFPGQPHSRKLSKGLEYGSDLLLCRLRSKLNFTSSFVSIKKTMAEVNIAVLSSFVAWYQNKSFANLEGDVPDKELGAWLFYAWFAFVGLATLTARSLRPGGSKGWMVIWGILINYGWCWPY